MPKAKWVVLSVVLGITLGTQLITAQVPVPKRHRANSGQLLDGTTFEGSPHVGALRLDFQTQGAVIGRVDDLRDQRGRFESWSQICLDAFLVGSGPDR